MRGWGIGCVVQNPHSDPRSRWDIDDEIRYCRIRDGLHENDEQRKEELPTHSVLPGQAYLGAQPDDNLTRVERSASTRGFGDELPMSRLALAIASTYIALRSEPIGLT